jgi:hypothetical protein
VPYGVKLFEASISGTTKATAAGDYLVTINATNKVGMSTRTFTLFIDL